MKKKKGAEFPEPASRLIRKANELVEARYRYDIWQMRVFAKVLTLIKPGDTDFYEYKIYLTDFIKEFGLKKGGNIYQFIKAGAEGLLQKKVVIDEDLDGRASELQTWLLSSVQSFKDGEEANYLQVTIHPKLKPYLLELRQKYLVYDIRNVLKLTSVYSVRIYELLKQYEKIGKRNFDVENLKLILGILPGEYKLYGHFKDKVILKAQSDLAAETDISFAFEEHKSGKRVVGITFYISANPARRGETEHKAQGLPGRVADAQALASLLESPFFAEVSEHTRGWGILDPKLRELFIEHGEENVRTGLQCTLDNLQQGKIKDNVAGFFIRAVIEGWKSGPQVKRALATERRRRTTEQMAQNRESYQKWETTLENLLDERRGAVNEIVRKLSAQDSTLAEQAVQSILAERLIRSLLQKSVKAPLDSLSMDEWRSQKPLRDAVIRQIEQMHPDAFRDVQKQFDEPIKQARRALQELKKA